MEDRETFVGSFFSFVSPPAWYSSSKKIWTDISFGRRRVLYCTVFFSREDSSKLIQEFRLIWTSRSCVFTVNRDSQRIYLPNWFATRILVNRYIWNSNNCNCFLRFHLWLLDECYSRLVCWYSVASIVSYCVLINKLIKLFYLMCEFWRTNSDAYIIWYKRGTSLHTNMNQEESILNNVNSLVGDRLFFAILIS